MPLIKAFGAGEWLSRVLVGFVAFCLTVQSVGVTAAISTFVRLAPEDCSEESTSECDLGETLHKSSRPRFAAAKKQRNFFRCFSPTASIILKSNVHVPGLATFLVGAGINLRC